MSTYAPIGDYAIIGDCHSAALVSRSGSIDWLCLPRFDSPSIFAALLDAEQGGCFSVRPVRDFRAQRRYLGDSAVLETRFTTESGVLRVVDAMPVAGEAERQRVLRAQHEVLRCVECTEGDVEVAVRFDPRPDYGMIRPRLRARGRLGLYYERGRQLLALRSEAPLETAPDRTDASTRVRLRQGERFSISLSVTHGEPAVVASLGDDAQRRVDHTLRWWWAWAGRCAYEGPYREAVVRSAITLKLMTYGPSGAVVAAPTTSLPETRGGVRNWDYRYCWLRDASLTLQALRDLGYRREAEAYVSWLLYTTRSIHRTPKVVYGVFGEEDLRETELTHLHGYDGAHPVRIGNAASRQLQLDNFGEIVDAVHEFVSRGGAIDRPTARLLVRLGRTVCRRWREPDEGIWEVRSSRQHHTHSKAMCWVALDRLIRMHMEGQIDAPVEQFRREADAIRSAIETHGYNEEIGSYTSVFDGDGVDASLLLLARYRYVPADSPRMLSTCERIDQQLRRNGLLFRYLNKDDGLPPGEGAFGICSFWAAETRARQGKQEEATEIFEYLLTKANDVGLFAEEIDVDTGEALGNFPQAFTHVGLVDAAVTLADEAWSPELGHPRARRSATTEQT